MHKLIVILLALSVIGFILWYGYNVVMAKLAWREYKKTTEQIRKLREQDPLNF